MNTMRHELVFSHPIQLTEEVKNQFTKEVKEKYDIVVLRYETGDSSLIVYTKGFRLGKKEFKSLLDKIRTNQDPIKVYIEDDVFDFYRSTTWK